MKLKKGSKAAKDFMAKLRNARKGKTKKISGIKKAAPIYVNILGQRVKKGTKLYTKLVAQKKHFDDLQKHEINGTAKHKAIFNGTRNIYVEGDGNFNSMAEVKETNKKNGFHYFDAKTMKYFNSKILTPLILGKYFITSEKFISSSGYSETSYTICKARENASIDRIKTFETKQSAKEHLRKLQ